MRAVRVVPLVVLAGCGGAPPHPAPAPAPPPGTTALTVRLPGGHRLAGIPLEG